MSVTSPPPVSPTNFPAVGRRRRDIEAEIAAHLEQVERLQRKIADLRTELNAVVPIATLPSKILIKIFLRRVEDGRWDWAYRWGHCPPPFPWAEILHVCERWRVIALQTPELWTWIVPRNTNVVRHALGCSAGLPLDIHTNGWKEHNVAAYKLLFAQLPRIRSAALHIDESICKILALPQFKTLGAPLLQTLGLHMERAITFVPKLSTLALPKLTSLTILAGPRSISEGLVRPTLKHLTIDITEAGGSIGANWVTTFLKNLTQLESLSITQSSGEPTPSGITSTLPAPLHTICLPRLKELYLEEHGDGYTSASIINHINFPLTTQIHLTLEETIDNPRWGAIVLSSVATKAAASMNADDMHRPQTVSIASSSQDDWYFIVELWSPEIISDPLELSLMSRSDGDLDTKRKRLSMNLTLKPAVQRGHILHSILSPFDLSEVSTMIVNDAYLNRDAWTQLSCLIPHLKRLSLKGYSSYGASHPLYALLPCNERWILEHNATLATSALDYLFRSLKTLEIKGMRFRQFHGETEEDDSILNVMKSLSSRKRRGMGLERLVLSDACNLTDEDCASMRNAGIARQIDVVGKRRYETSGEARLY